MSAGLYNLVIEQGATFWRDLLVTDPNGVEIDYSTSAIRAMIRAAYTDALPLVTFSCSYVPGTGVIIELTAVQTALLPANTTGGVCPYVWDLETETAGTVERLLYGTVKVRPGATK